MSVNGNLRMVATDRFLDRLDLEIERVVIILARIDDVLARMRISEQEMEKRQSLRTVTYPGGSIRAEGSL
jgi:hypothetical protein